MTKGAAGWSLPRGNPTSFKEHQETGYDQSSARNRRSSLHHPGETECLSESDPRTATGSSSIVTWQFARCDGSTITVAAALIIIVCIPFLINGFDLVQLAADPSAMGDELQHALEGLSDGGPRQVRTYAVIGAGMMLGLCLLALTLAAGVFRRKEGAHRAMIVAILGLIALTASSPGLLADPPRRERSSRSRWASPTSASSPCFLLIRAARTSSA